ncbi:MAG: PAS domain-containing protein [Gammaproteobacteria bacterium]
MSTRHEQLRPDSAAPTSPPQAAAAAHLAGVACAAPGSHLLHRYAPACAIVDPQGAILFLGGAVERFLCMPGGELPRDLADLADDGLRGRLLDGIRRARHDGCVVEIAGAWVRREDEFVAVAVAIEPMRQGGHGAEVLLVTFAEDGMRAESIRPGNGAPPPQALRVPDSTAEESPPARARLDSLGAELCDARAELQRVRRDLQIARVDTKQDIAPDGSGRSLRSLLKDIESFLAGTDLAALFVDREGCVRSYTPAMTRMLRLDPADIGRPFSDLPASFADVRMAGDVRAAIERGTISAEEIRSDDGRWFIRRIEPFQSQAGTHSGAIVYLTDITPHRRASEAECRLAAFVRATPAAVVLLDPQGVILEWNAGAARLFGIDAAQTVGRDVRTIVRPDTLKELNRLLAAIERGEALNAYERVHWNTRGQPFHLAWTADQVRDPGGTYLGVLAVGTDVTDTAQVEQQVAALADEQRQRIGRDLHDTLGQQLAALGLIASALEGALAAGGQAQPLVERLEDGVELAKKQLRTIVRGIAPVDIEANSLAHALDDLADSTRRDHGIECVARFQGGGAQFGNFTATQIYLIAREAVRNCVSHAGARRIDIILDLRAPARLEIRDDGAGIDEMAGAAAGFGLRIMRHRCRILGGNMHIDSGPGQGTAVICDLPGLGDPSAARAGDFQAPP